MNRTPRGLALFFVLLLSACATIGLRPGGGERDELWTEAHLALRAERFGAADSAFSRLVAAHPEAEEGREALFFLGATRLDPRNPAWSSRQAADYLRRYLAQADSGRKVEIHRRPEAVTLLQLANQLNMPAEQRISALQPQTQTERVAVPGPVRVVPGDQARELAAEVERLRRLVAEREETIRKQREELERIRNTLAPGRRP